ncbi:4,5-DOPA dioxygenase extradiol [Pseudoxanthomonas daejeonensis]|uniref:4,5-DOPA dioxygenase extradiol n=1 Tax=Pseudoxanthomonas daejeonensis TaxID=266062 RepID=A0ABQ6Z8W6_9GAMM|nr:4,5-DOPA dioxygenase extradiol [Pseudoxanthomonas daejeonensis]KAF1695490.1 4,5-DOPA dioxygenase extradiol [Pseudoxanthomonas daejeonensis]UNK58300.1 4,5-DOPA dioxygenase extradiol [Pseudoxanthomonas daejeonensis]
MTAHPMPAAFLGHGSPMNALESNRFTEAWRSFGASVPKPRAILAVSAHWYVNATAVTAMAQPRTIHDFYGFPQALFDVQYPAPGLPELVEEVSEAVKPDHVGADIDGWGIDHGTWSVLVHAFPDADIPVVQLSIDARRPPEWHLALGAKLAALREQGVLVVGSGNVVHNLRAIDWQQPDGAFDWARRFDEHARELMIERPHDIPSLVSHPDFRLAVPSPDHFLPLLYIAGLTAASGREAEVLVDGYAYGSLSMTAYTLDARCPRPVAGDLDGAASLQTRMPPEDANI